MAEAGARLLVVDDEAMNLEALCDGLSASGFQVQACKDGVSALQALMAQPFDLLLTDLHMPGMQGDALVRAARERDPLLACVVMTGAGTLDAAVDAMRAGAVDFILKPLRMRIALPAIRRALQLRQLQQANQDLQNQVLRQRDELASANRDLEAFSSSVSHDLRTPLHAIAAFTQILQQRHAQQLDEAGQQHLARIAAAASNMAELIQGMLRLAHVLQHPLELEPVSLQALAQEALDHLAAAGLAQAAQVHIDGLPEVECDAALMRQVFQNLIGNACKFSAKVAQPRVEVGARLQDGGTVIFVRDNGAGLDMAQARELFQPFKRLHGTREFPGLGIGLSIVHRILERHGGRIGVESAPGEGACFLFTLPMGADRPMPAPTHP